MRKARDKSALKLGELVPLWGLTDSCKWKNRQTVSVGKICLFRYDRNYRSIFTRDTILVMADVNSGPIHDFVVEESDDWPTGYIHLLAYGVNCPATIQWFVESVIS